MSYYSFRPRKTFNADLARLGKLDPSIIDDIHEAIDILLNGDVLPKEYRDHNLQRKYARLKQIKKTSINCNGITWIFNSE